MAQQIVYENNLFKIQKTMLGKFIVRYHGDQEAGKFSDLDAAIKFADEKRDAIHNETLSTNARADQIDAHWDAYAKRQIEWQNWRSWLYDKTMWAERRAAQWERSIDRRLEQINERVTDSSRAMYHTERALRDTDDAGAQADWLRALYEQAVTLDTTMKRTRREMSDTYPDALAACEQFMNENRHCA